MLLITAIVLVPTVPTIPTVFFSLYAQQQLTTAQHDTTSSRLSFYQNHLPSRLPSLATRNSLPTTRPRRNVRERIHVNFFPFFDRKILPTGTVTLLRYKVELDQESQDSKFQSARVYFRKELTPEAIQRVPFVRVLSSAVNPRPFRLEIKGLYCHEYPSVANIPALAPSSINNRPVLHSVSPEAGQQSTGSTSKLTTTLQRNSLSQVKNDSYSNSFPTPDHSNGTSFPSSSDSSFNSGTGISAFEPYSLVDSFDAEDHGHSVILSAPKPHESMSPGAPSSADTDRPTNLNTSPDFFRFLPHSISSPTGHDHLSKAKEPHFQFSFVPPASSTPTNAPSSYNTHPFVNTHPLLFSNHHSKVQSPTAHLRESVVLKDMRTTHPRPDPSHMVNRKNQNLPKLVQTPDKPRHHANIDLRSYEKTLALSPTPFHRRQQKELALFGGTGANWSSEEMRRLVPTLGIGLGLSGDDMRSRTVFPRVAIEHDRLEGRNDAKEMAQWVAMRGERTTWLGTSEFDACPSRRVMHEKGRCLAAGNSWWQGRARLDVEEEDDDDSD